MQRYNAKRAQAKHWETLGQISSMYGLINYIIGHNPYLPTNTRQALLRAQVNIGKAWDAEAQNNQFINLNLPRGF